MTLSRSVPLSTWIVASLLAAGLVGVAVLSFVGLPSWLLLLVVPVPWILVIGSRRGVGFAASAVVLVSFWLLLAVMMLTTVNGLPMLGTVMILWTILGLLGVVLCVRNPGAVRLPSAHAVATWVPAVLGGAVWLGAVAATNFVTGASRFAWVMLGDSANNLIFAREVIYRGGVVLGGEENPVPLPSVLMAIVMASGREGAAPDSLTAHDISAFAEVWMILIALTCLTVGAMAASITRAVGAQPVAIALVAAGASLIPLSWFVTGYPLEFGFFNTHVALPVVMVSFVAYLSSGRRASLAISMQLLAATLLLATWSPLVLLPAFLGLAVVVRNWREVVATRGLDLVILLVAIAQAVLYGVGVVIPSLLAQSQFLSAPGGAFGFRRWIILGLAVAAVVLAAVTFHGVRNLVTMGTVATVLASGVGLGTLLFITRDSENPWSYYPLKFAWLTAVVLTVLIVGLSSAFVVRYFRRFLRQGIGLVLVAVGSIGFLNWTPNTVGHTWNDPISRLLVGDFQGHGDEVTERIFRLATLEQANVLWQSDDAFEGPINFWIMQIWANSMTENVDLRTAAYGLYDHDKVESLCTIVNLMGGDVVVHTASPHLGEELNDTCPVVAARVSIRLDDR